MTCNFQQRDFTSDKTNIFTHGQTTYFGQTTPSNHTYEPWQPEMHIDIG